MKIEPCYNLSVFELDNDNISFELSEESKMLLAYLQNRISSSRYCFVNDDFIPLNYQELSDELRYPKNVIKKCFAELEYRGFVCRYVARFVQIKANARV